MQYTFLVIVAVIAELTTIILIGTKGLKVVFRSFSFNLQYVTCKHHCNLEYVTWHCRNVRSFNITPIHNTPTYVRSFSFIVTCYSYIMYMV